MLRSSSFLASWVCRSCLSALRTPARPVVRGIRWASNESADLHPSLLKRARALAAEHGVLTTQLESGYDSTAANRAGELSHVVSALRDWDAGQNALDELRTMLASSDTELRELAADEFTATSERIQSLSRRLSESLTPKHPWAELPCLLEVLPGPGGIEGRLFADAIVRMYRAFSARKGYNANLVKYELAESAGDFSGGAGEQPLQEAVLEFTFPGAYGMLRGEAGMHRVQRVPATERTGRTHTSAVAVWVLPSFPDSGGAADSYDNPESDMYLDPADVRVESMRARGAGGQHVNKTESAIRLTHVPTGVVVSMQDHRSKQRNRDEAFKVLRGRIAMQRREAREEEAAKLRDSVLSQDRITRSDKVRTYNYGQDRCTDHRSGLTVHNLPDVLEGGATLEKVINSVGDWMMEKEIAVLLAEEAQKSAKKGE